MSAKIPLRIQIALILLVPAQVIEWIVAVAVGVTVSTTVTIDRWRQP